MKAAQYLNTTPWDLGQQSLDYLLQAEQAQAAEHDAEAARKDRRTGG